MVINALKHLPREGATAVTGNEGEDNIRIMECTRGNKKILVVADIPREERCIGLTPSEETWRRNATSDFSFHREELWGTPLKAGKSIRQSMSRADKGGGRHTAYRQAGTVAQWKRTFYSAYQRRQFDRAGDIYQSRLSFDQETPDVHAAYRQHRRVDLQIGLLAGMLSIVALLLVWLLMR